MGKTLQWNGLVSTCHQIREEAGLLPYTRNVFATSSTIQYDTLFSTLKTLCKPIHTLQLRWTLANIARVQMEDRSNLVMVLPSVKKVVMYLVISESRLGAEPLRFWDMATNGNEIEWIKMIVRWWLGADKDEGLETVFVVDEVED
jgi:hypothetical protein